MGATHTPADLAGQPATGEDPAPVAWPPRRDLLCALAREHRDLDALATWLIRRPPRPSDRGTIDRFLQQMTLHEVAEEVLLGPVMDAVLDGSGLATQRDVEQLALLATSDQLRDLPTLAVDDLRGLHQRFVEHSDREELEVFPHLRHVLSPRQLASGWQQLERLRRRMLPGSEPLAGPTDDAWRSDDVRRIARSLVTGTDGRP